MGGYKAYPKRNLSVDKTVNLQTGKEYPSYGYSRLVGAYSNACGANSIAIGYGSCAQPAYSCINPNYPPFYMDTPFEYPKTANTFTTIVRKDEPIYNELKYFYRQKYIDKLKDLKINGIGKNTFDLIVNTDRDDTKICNEILNNFNNKTMGTFEQRLHDALKRKEELKERKKEILKEMQDKYVKAQKVFSEKIKKLSEENNVNGINDFLKEHNGQLGNDFKTYIDNIKKGLENPTQYIPNINDHLNSQEKLDDKLVKMYLNYITDYNDQQEIVEEDGVKYIDITYGNALIETDVKFKPIKACNAKILKAKKSVLGDSVNKEYADFVENISYRLTEMFGKKKWYYSKVRFEYNKLLEVAKLN